MIPSLICIMGPDGAGKTTQANLLIQYFINRGHYAEYRWIRFFHFFSLPLLGIARLLRISEEEIISKKIKIGYHYFYKSRIISHLYPKILFCDMFFYYLLRVYFPLWTRKNTTFIVDRCIYDTLIDLMVSTHLTNFPSTLLGKMYIRLIPRDALLILLIGDSETIKKRRIDISFDKSFEEKIGLYKTFSNYQEIKTVNSTGSMEDVNKRIIEMICL